MKLLLFAGERQDNRGEIGSLQGTTIRKRADRQGVEIIFWGLEMMGHTGPSHTTYNDH
jgi:hypothetical protein